MDGLGFLVAPECLATTWEDHEVPRKKNCFHLSKKMLPSDWGFSHFSLYIPSRRPLCLTLIYSKPEPTSNDTVMIHGNNMTTKST